MSFTVLKDGICFMRLKSSDQKKGIMQLLSLVSTIRGTKLNVKTPATMLRNTAFPQIYCNVKVCDVCKKKSVRCNRKATFHYNGKLLEVFRAGLNESEYNYVDSKLHFYLKYHVAATDMKPLCKKKRHFKQCVPRVYRAWG